MGIKTVIISNYGVSVRNWPFFLSNAGVQRF